MSIAFLFPGQGSQSVGMGKALAESFEEARDVFSEVDDTLDQHLSKLMFEGDQDQLTDTRNAQPALMAVSVAVTRVLEKQSGKSIQELCQFVAGHSLGEYSALCAAGAISLSDTARLLRTRGTAMQEAVPPGQGGMVALVGTDFETAQDIANQASSKGPCQAANDNGGGQVVVSGAMAAVDQVITIAQEKGIKRAVKLPVSAPFHSTMMEPAAIVMKDALAGTNVISPSVPLIANVTASEVTDPQTIKDLLVDQVTGMVRWRESMLHLAEKNVNHVVECGAGKVLAGLMRRIDKEIATTCIGTPEDIESYIETL